MKKLTNLFVLSMVALMAILSSCGVENPVEPLGPTATLRASANAVVDSAQVALGDTFLVSLSATAGDAALNRIEVRENGVSVDPSRIIFDGFAAQNNPNPLGGVDQLDWEIEIQAPDAEGTFEYAIIVTDENQNVANTGVSITTFMPETVANERTMIMLLNQGGPIGQGGLDLDTGTETGTTAADTAADIRDMGIDTNQIPANNWIQKIASINGTTLKLPAAGVMWDDIETIEDIAAAFAQGTEIVGESEVVQEEDFFLIEATTGILYAILVTDVTVVTTDNSDSYTFTVKGQ
ncbi:MAG: hypothetical protein AAF804_11925 [Bacteroidota bacterium]